MFKLLRYENDSKALSTHNHEDFEKIILGGSRKLVNPEGPLAISLEGCNSVQLTSPPPATLASQEQAAKWTCHSANSISRKCDLC